MNVEIVIGRDCSMIKETEILRRLKVFQFLDVRSSRSDIWVLQFVQLVIRKKIAMILSEPPLVRVCYSTIRSTRQKFRGALVL